MSYHCESYINDIVSSLEKISYPKESVEFVIVDNPHPEYGPSISYIEEQVLPLSGKSIPHVTLLPQKTNIGFAAGNNAGISWALANGFDYVYFHNNDGFMAANCLEILVKALEADKQIGVAQSLLLLYPDTNLVNSAGNSFHYLGFGYCDNFRVKKDSLSLKPVEEVGYASGASLLMRASFLKQYGLWQGDFFLYHEDLEYSLRMRLAGYKVVLVSDAIFYHKYSFNRSKVKFGYMERNRYAVMLMYFRWPTLLLLLPMAIVMEFGLIFFSIINGWFKQKMNAYYYWLKLSSWKLWLGKRKDIQSIREISDRAMLKYAVSTVAFDERSLHNPLLKYVANPLMTVYWMIIRQFIFW